jgi:hypothetical protein
MKPHHCRFDHRCRRAHRSRGRCDCMPAARLRGSIDCPGSLRYSQVQQAKPREEVGLFDLGRCCRNHLHRRAPDGRHGSALRQRGSSKGSCDRRQTSGSPGVCTRPARRTTSSRSRIRRDQGRLGCAQFTGRIGCATMGEITAAEPLRAGFHRHRCTEPVWSTGLLFATRLDLEGEPCRHLRDMEPERAM